MALARKCDRCGRLYEEPKDGEVCGIRWAIGPHWELGKLLDLCPDCTDKLSGWIEGEEKIPVKESVGDDTMEEIVQPIEAPQSVSIEEVEEVGEVITSKPDKTAVNVEEIVRERLSGKMPKQIAKERGLKPNTISRYISLFKDEQPERYAELQLATGTEGNP